MMRWRMAILLRRPVHPTLIVLLALLATATIASAIGTYRALALTPASEVFDIHMAAPIQGGGTLQLSLFDAVGMAELRVLAPAVAEAALVQNVAERTVVAIGDLLYEFRAAAAVSPTYFAVTGTDVVQGRAFQDGDLRFGEIPVLVSEASALTLFSGASAVGEVVRLHPQRTPLRIVGVFRHPAWASNTYDAPALLLANLPGALAPLRSSIVRVLSQEGRANVAHEQAMVALRSVYGSEIVRLGYLPEQTLRLGRGEEDTTLAERVALDALVYGLLGTMALMIAAIGTYSLTTVEVAGRSKEIGMQRAIGASRGTVVSAVVGEMLVLTSLGAALGVGVAVFGTQLVQRFRPGLFWGQGTIALDVTGTIGAFLIVVLLGGIMAVIPVLQFLQEPPADQVREA